jgi:hypothetical protein
MSRLGTGMNRRQLTFCVDAAMRDALKTLAQRERNDVSSVLRRLVARGLEAEGVVVDAV